MRDTHTDTYLGPQDKEEAMLEAAVHGPSETLAIVVLLNPELFFFSFFLW